MPTLADRLRRDRYPLLGFPVFSRILIVQMKAVAVVMKVMAVLELVSKAPVRSARGDVGG
jgi:hypothetical protein